MKLVKLFPFVAVLLLLYATAVPAARDTTGTSFRGEDLVRQIYTDLKEGKFADIERHMAPGFQSVRESGANNRKAEIAYLRSLDLADFTLSNFKVTRNGPLLIVTYMLSETREIYSNTMYKTTPAPRLSVFSVQDKDWQWVAHATSRICPSPR